MSVLADILQKVKSHGRFVEEQVQRARQEPDFRKEVLKKFESLRAAAGTVVTPTGLKLPRLALPQTDDPGEIARYLFGEGAPGEFPFVNAAYAPFRRAWPRRGHEQTFSHADQIPKDDPPEHCL